MRKKLYSIYIISNRYNTVLYTGITSDLPKRISRHKMGLGSKFASRYRINKLVYSELFEDVRMAIRREKQIKNYSEDRKRKMVSDNNPE